MVTDLWFNSCSSLADLAQALDLTDVIQDQENYWEWVIGNYREARIDITRTHTKSPETTPTRIFRYEDENQFDEALILDIVDSLHSHGVHSVNAGQWKYVTGNEFDLIVHSTHEKA